jgi:threonine synthase
LIKHVSSFSYNDELTEKVMQDVYQKHHYMLDPHAAVAYLAMEDWIARNPSNKGFILGTAHPVKFPTVVERVIKDAVPLPDQVASIIKKEKKAIQVAPNFAIVKEIIIQLAS